MKISAELYFAEALKIVDRIKTEELDNIKKAAKVLASTIAADGVVHVFGPGHSKSFALEMSNRAGGLVPINAILMDDLILRGGMCYEELNVPTTERNPDMAHELLKIHAVKAPDCVVICSNSGINGSVIELALEAKRRGLPVIAVTSLAHSSQSKSRHPGGKHLFELADVVINNCCPHGDAIMDAPGIPIKVCGGSSVANMFIAQSLNSETLQLLYEKGYEVPVFMSQNIEGADERNEALRKKYEGRVAIRYT